MTPLHPAAPRPQEPLACPFCANTDIAAAMGNDGGGWYAGCTPCQMFARSEDTLELALAKWNARRALPAAPAAGPEKVEASAGVARDWKQDKVVGEARSELLDRFHREGADTGNYSAMCDADVDAELLDKVCEAVALCSRSAPASGDGGRTPLDAMTEYERKCSVALPPESPDVIEERAKIQARVDELTTKIQQLTATPASGSAGAPAAAVTQKMIDAALGVIFPTMISNGYTPNHDERQYATDILEAGLRAAAGAGGGGPMGEWTPDQKLRAGATDADIEQRVTHLESVSKLRIGYQRWQDAAIITARELLKAQRHQWDCPASPDNNVCTCTPTREGYES